MVAYTDIAFMNNHHREVYQLNDWIYDELENRNIDKAERIQNVTERMMERNIQWLTDKFNCAYGCIGKL